MLKKLILIGVFLYAWSSAHSQTPSTLTHIDYTWNGSNLTVCPTGQTALTSCVADYALTLTDPTGHVGSTIRFAYPSAAYTFRPGGFLICGDWQASLVIEYFGPDSKAAQTAANTAVTTVACPFVVSPPSGLKGVPSA